MNSAPPPIDRQIASNGRRKLAIAIGFCLRPIVKFLEWIGIYAWLLGKGLRKFRQGNFGDYSPTENDVIVCSGMKSGTNWTMQIAVQIAHRGDGQFEHIHDLVPWPELPKRATFAIDINDNMPRDGSPTGLRVIKTHLPMHSVPYTPEARYICVVRDPKDVLVSAYFFFGALAGPFMPSLPTWLKISTSPDALEGGWADHLNSYWQIRDRDNVLFLTFEHMKEDLSGVVDLIANHMGVSLTPEEHTAVVEKSSFEYMKQQGHKFDPIGLGFPGGKASGAMVRRGERGKSDELLSVADRNRIDDFWRSALVRVGSDFPYDETFSPN